MAKKVLIVDDSALVRKQLSEIIDTLGFEIGFCALGSPRDDKHGTKNAAPPEGIRLTDGVLWYPYHVVHHIHPTLLPERDARP